MTEALEQIQTRLINVPSWNIYQVLDSGDDVGPYYRVTGAIAYDLVVRDECLREQVQTVAAQIMHWGRWTAQAKRVWQIVDHKFRVWRDGYALECIDPEDKPDGWKKPTQEQVKQLYRTHPSYTTWQIEIERAEEAYNATLAVYEGFKMKKEMLRLAIRRREDNGQPTLDIL